MSNNLFFSSAWLPAGILALGLLGCRKPKVPRPLPSIKLAVEAEAAATINRDVNGDPNSVVVRIYHLKAKGEFSKLTFDLINSGRTDQELLGDDFIGRSEFVAVPGNTLRETVELTPGSAYIGVVALFRKPDPHYWRYLVSKEQLDIARTRKKDWQGKKLPLFSFRVEDCFMNLNYSKAEFIPGQPLNAKPECGGYANFASTRPLEPVQRPNTMPPAKPGRSDKSLLPPKPAVPGP